MLETAVLAAKEAGKILKENYGKVREEKIKGGNWRDIVTNVDLASNKKILEVIQKAFPEHDIVSEEIKVPKKGSEYCWYIDPVDGTTNYTLHFDYTCINIGLAKNGEIILGVVYNPLMDEMFVAEKGKGATLNGKPVRVSENTDIHGTVANYCHQNVPDEIRMIEKVFFDFKDQFRDLRRFGAAGLDFAWIACGRNDAFFHTNTKPSLWDFVAGVILLREAGGKVTEWDGKTDWTLKSKTLLATNGRIHDTVVRMLSKIKEIGTED